MQTETLEQGNEIITAAIATATPWVLNAIAALVILFLGLFVASWIKRTVKGLFAKSSLIDPMLEGFLSSLVYYAIVALVVIAVLDKFGVPVTSLAAILGAAGLAIGLALQGTLSHVASGVMLLAFRPFKIGDYIEAGGEEGSVKNITLFTTELATVDNKQIIIPNGQIWDSSITNFSAHANRRLDLVFGVSYDDDLGKARDIILKIANADSRVQKDPEPLVEVNNLGDYSVDFTVRLWCAKGDYFPLKWEMNRKIKEAFDAEGVTIPFPTQIELQYDAKKE